MGGERTGAAVTILKNLVNWLRSQVLGLSLWLEGSGRMAFSFLWGQSLLPHRSPICSPLECLQSHQLGPALILPFLHFLALSTLSLWHQRDGSKVPMDCAPLLHPSGVSPGSSGWHLNSYSDIQSSPRGDPFSALGPWPFLRFPRGYCQIFLSDAMFLSLVSSPPRTICWTPAHPPLVSSSVVSSWKMPRHISPHLRGSWVIHGEWYSFCVCIFSIHLSPPLVQQLFSPQCVSSTVWAIVD